MFGATSKVKNIDKEKWVYIGYGIATDGKNKSLFSHADNGKNNFLVLGEGEVSFSVSEKKFSINVSKTKKKLYLSLQYNGDNSYLVLNGKEIFKFKANKENVYFPTQFWLGSISNKLGATESREISLGGNFYYFSVDYNTIDKSDISNIHKYLMVKNNMK